MGIENLEKTIRKAEKGSAQKEAFNELTEKEQEVMEKVKAIFRENADLNKLLLCEEDLDLSDHQKRYLIGRLAGFRRETKGVLQKLRSAVPAQTADVNEKRKSA